MLKPLDASNGGSSHTAAMADAVTVSARGGGEVVVSNLPPSAGLAVVIAPALASTTYSGRYRGRVSSFELELRVDIDGARPCHLVSGDLYRVAGTAKIYQGSLKSGPLHIAAGASTVTVDGPIATSFQSLYSSFTLTLSGSAAARIAIVTFYTSAGSAGSTYQCAFVDGYFRTVELEQDVEGDATLFKSYDTATLPHGGTARLLDVVSAYAEAGIEVRLTEGTNQIPAGALGVDAVWTNAELEAAMHQHFSRISDSPSWQCYLLVCKSRHELTTPGSTLFGIMFDYEGSSQRQGCAVFQSEIDRTFGGAGSSAARRHTLYCYVHEIGHAFNLLHSWDKSRPDALSWMNYDSRYDLRHGGGGYWGNFGFEFDTGELAHLRHAFRNHVVMGGDNWDTNPALVGGEQPIDITRPIVSNEHGLAFTLEAKPSYAFSEPVVVQLELSLRGRERKSVIARLHPHFGFVKVAIRKPGGKIVTYEPLADHLIVPRMLELGDDNPSITESVYLGYGRAGHYFDEPGTYVVKAAYFSADGGIISTPDVTIRVRAPLSAEDERVAELYLGDQQGRLFYLLGSDGAHLQKGNDAFTTVLLEHAAHPLSVYAALANGINAAREFKSGDGNRPVRRRNPAMASQLIGEVLDKCQRSRQARIDRITLSYAVRKAAESNVRDNNRPQAKHDLAALSEFLQKQKMEAHERRHAEKQIAAVLK